MKGGLIMCVNKDPEICSLCGGCAKPIHCVPVDSGEEIPWEELELQYAFESRRPGNYQTN